MGRAAVSSSRRPGVERRDCRAGVDAGLRTAGTCEGRIVRPRRSSSLHREPRVGALARPRDAGSAVEAGPCPTDLARAEQDLCACAARSRGQLRVELDGMCRGGSRTALAPHSAHGSRRAAKARARLLIGLETSTFRSRLAPRRALECVMKETDESPIKPVDNNARSSRMESFLWIAIPIAIMALIVWAFWP